MWGSEEGDMEFYVGDRIRSVGEGGRESEVRELERGGEDDCVVCVN